MSLKKEVSFYWVLVAAAAALVVISAYAFVTDVKRLHQSGLITYPVMQNFRLWRMHRAETIPLTVDNVRDWMTFDYLNQSFHLPSDYLKTKLEITNQKYPRITLDEIAEGTHTPASAVLTAVQNAIREYTTPPAAISPTPTQPK